MRYNDLLLEYDRERARQALGDGLWKAALRDDLQLWGQRLENLQDYPGIKAEIIDDTFKDPRMQRERADRALHAIEQADPSTNKKYTQWMARQFATGQVAKMEDVVSTLADYVARFHTLSTRKKLPVDRRDINRYRKYQEMFDTVDWYEDADEEADKGKSRKEYEDDEVTVIVPEDQAASCYYGKDTRWCTATKSSRNYFEHYSNQGPLYIVIPKQPHRDGEKYQLHFESGQFMDENDDPIDLASVLGDQFPGLLKHFMGKEETAKYIKDMVDFADDDTLQDISDQIWAKVQDQVFDVLSDWEISDDYYYTWLRDEGYVDEDGNLKDDAPSYLDYNDEARRWEMDIEEYAHPGPLAIRRMASQALADGEFDENSIYKIEDYIAYNIRYQMRKENDGGIADWISRNIMIKPTPDGPKVEKVKR